MRTNLRKAWLDKIPSRLHIQTTLVMISTYFSLRLKKLYITPDDLLQANSKMERDMDLTFLESVSTDVSAMTDPAIQPL